MQLTKILFLLISCLILTAFDWSHLQINRKDIHRGGPPKDGIPALTHPKLLTAHEASYLHNNDRVLGIVVEGMARAYPLNILNWHEIVNDSIGGLPVCITWCPLCGSGIAFDAAIEGKTYTFGVSGLLYQSDVLLYDQTHEALWTQLGLRALSGPLADKPLTPLPLTHTTWEAWKRKYPDTTVLAKETGYQRNYDRNPYTGYENSEKLFFPVRPFDKRLPAKTWILGLQRGGATRAYPLESLSSNPITDNLGDQTHIIEYDPIAQSAIVKDISGKEIPSVQCYWFAWAAFHPETEIGKP